VKAYIVYCHPDPESFTAAVFARAVDTLQAAGHEVRISDLYADNFEPEMSLQERLDHRAPPEFKPGIAEYSEPLRWCDTLVFVYPTWWGGQPAMLTGWLDRVLERGAGQTTARLTNVRRLVAITSHGSSRFVNILEGETGRRVVGRTVRVLCYRFARTTWLALYNIDRSTANDRAAFLDRVEGRLTRL
jgi:NAD(P)H dehydrogenase (quinone)